MCIHTLTVPESQARHDYLGHHTDIRIVVFKDMSKQKPGKKNAQGSLDILQKKGIL